MKKLLFLIIPALLLTGCFAGKAFDGNAYGAYANTSGLFMMGNADITTIPQEMLFFKARYEEDTAFFSPSTKIRSWSVTCSGGTNWIPVEVFTTCDMLQRAVSADTNAAPVAMSVEVR